LFRGEVSLVVASNGMARGGAERRTAPSIGMCLLMATALTILDCHAETHIVECERLQHFSCECFVPCLTDDQKAIESGDPDRCSAQLRKEFDTWQVCASGIRASGQRCDENCMSGWGSCAFEVFREAGLMPANVCGGDSGG